MGPYFDNGAIIGLIGIPDSGPMLGDHRICFRSPNQAVQRHTCFTFLCFWALTKLLSLSPNVYLLFSQGSLNSLVEGTVGNRKKIP